ncbi:MAG: translation elongation factor Ts [Elusimicrobia bacterium]|nr:translation elongation factor Ts [Elusimicrobiota bacterium]
MSTAEGSINEKVMALRNKTGAGIMDCKKALVESNGDMDKAVESLRKKGLADLAKRSARATKEGLVALKLSDDGRKAAMVELNCETDFVAKTPDFKGLAKDLAELVYSKPASADPTQDASAKELVLKIAPKVGENMSFRRGLLMEVPANAVIGHYIHTDEKKAALVEIEFSGGLKADAARNIARELALQAVAMSPRWCRQEEVPADIIEKEKEIYRVNAKNQGKPDAAIEKMLVGRVRKFMEESCLLMQASIRDSKLSVSDYVDRMAKEQGGAAVVKRFVRYQLGAE